MSFAILGLADAFPPAALPQVEAARAAVAAQGLDGSAARALAALYRRSGVSERRSVLLGGSGSAASDVAGFYPPHRLAGDRGPTTHARMAVYEREAGLLAARAAASALRDAALSASAVTHLITVSCTGASSPGLDHHLIRTLELPPTVARCHVGFMGCHGAFNALRVADAFAAADAGARVLVAAVELCTLHFSYGGESQSDVASALFGDGAAAMLCGPAAAARGEPWRAAAFGSVLLADSAADMTWRIGDHGFEMELSPRVPDFIRAELRPWLEPWLAAQGLRVGDVASWALHPGGPRILAAIEEVLELPSSATATSHQVLAEVGNVSSPTVLCILNRLRARCAPRPCVALGFGPGLVIEAALWV